MDIFNYSRRKTTPVSAGSLIIGGDSPVRVQSMTTTNTRDTDACVRQAESIIKAGGELVRLTTQGTIEAENLRNIKAGIRADGYATPLVADVHFNPDVADVAATIVEGVRINPGNYVDPARRFIKHEYTDEEYAAELDKLEKRFVKLINICKEHHTALRIGVNHGSLSDRIRNRYGDTPEGIVESCMEFLRICRKQHFDNVVISIKSSNTVVMVRSVRLLVSVMEKEGMSYPLHLGVTEAGEGENGRIKSAVGIGALLADGIGDTIRVSLSEEPAEEIPVARHLADYIAKRQKHVFIPADMPEQYDWLNPTRRETVPAGIIGGSNVPIVIANMPAEAADTNAGISGIYDSDKTPDYIYAGSKLPEDTDGKQKYIIDFNIYADMQARGDKRLESKQFCPIFPVAAIPLIGALKADVKFLVLQFGTPAEEYLTCLKMHPEVVVVCNSMHQNRLGDQRALAAEMMNAGVKNPIVFCEAYRHGKDEKSDFQTEAAADLGALLIDGLADGIWLLNDGDISSRTIADTAFGILQAARLRITATEYISCPGCGRTLYDLRDTIQRIKAATAGMKGLKIGIMGCIVNGPGEMADADYGYVGAGPKKVSLYRKQVCIEKNIPEEEAVPHLLALINADRENKK